MNFFKRDKEPAAVSLAGDLKPVYKPSASIVGKTASSDDIRSARASVDSIVGELKSTADQHSLAAKRMAGLNKTIAKMEAGLRHVERLETDNAELRSSLQNVQKKLEQKTSWALEQESKLVTIERQHNDLREKFEEAKADIAQRKDREVGDREKLMAQGREIEGLSGQINQKDERLSALELSNHNLQDEITQTSGELSTQNHRVMELQKSNEEQAARLDSKTKEADGAAVELKNLRLDFNEVKAKYFEASGALENAKYDLKTQKNVNDDTLKRRDDEALALKSRIEQLNTQLRIKENMSTHFDEEIVTLRNTLETERERNERNEQRFRGKADEVERSVRAIARAKVEYEDLNAKFTAAMEDIDTLRKINQVQKQKLERYAAIGGVSIGQSMIASDIARSGGASTPSSANSRKRDSGGSARLKAV